MSKIQRSSGLFYGRESLDVIFNPKSVAIVGATEKVGSVGRTLVHNLISNPFGGTVYPVNLKRPSVLGIKAYPSLTAIGEPIDLAVIVTPAQTVPSVITECVELGIKGAIVISAGFKEVGEEGRALEEQILSEARRGHMRIIGPNCLGVMNPINGFNATFATGIADPGNVGFISQSGALCTAVLDWSLTEHVGFSAFVSIGSMLDVGWGDLIYYLGNDPNTESIVIYMETVGDARSFLSAAREVALTKPIIVIKAGRTAAAAKAAASHTGSLAGSDEVLDAAFRRCGVLRVNKISDVFYIAEVLAKQPRPNGNRLAVVTNAGGPGVLATDALISEGGQLAELSEQTYAELDEILPGAWSHNNPVDILGDAEPTRYAKALEVVGKDPNSDGLLVILTPQDMTDPTETAQELIPYAHIEDKPVLASWMGASEVAEGERILNAAGIPTFPYPDTATRLFNHMWRFAYNLRGLYETPSVSPEFDENPPNSEEVKTIVEQALANGQTILNEFDSKRVLAAYGIPVVETIAASTEDEAVKAAKKIGYPVVLKLYSETVTHKTDVGGVRLDLNGEEEVRLAYNAIKNAVTEKVGEEHFQGVTVQPMIDLSDGYEIIIGSSIDEQFGPVLLFGTGGSLVEVFKDRALGLPPLNTTLARRMMEQTTIHEALKGVRGRDPVDLDALAEIMVRFSQLVAEHPWIEEMDINPLLASSEQLLALDARVMLHNPDTNEQELPMLAIRPYPSEYIMPYESRSGRKMTIRPIKPEDEPLMVKFHEALSNRTVVMRYARPMELSELVSHDRLSRISFIDYDREIVLVMEDEDDFTNEKEIAAVGRMNKIYGTSHGEFAIIVADRYQRQGIGTDLIGKLAEVARAEGLTHLVGYIIPDNSHMRAVCERLGFTLEDGDQRTTAILEL